MNNCFYNMLYDIFNEHQNNDNSNEFPQYQSIPIKCDDSPNSSEMIMTKNLYNEFMEDGIEIYYIAMILEMKSSDNFITEPLMGFLKNNIHTSKYFNEYLDENDPINEVTINKYTSKFIKGLLVIHANLYNITLTQAVKKWLPKFERYYSQKANILKEIHLDSEWEWLHIWS